MNHASTAIRRFVAILFVTLLFIPFISAPAIAQSTPAATPAASAPKFVIRPLDGLDGDYFTLEAEAGTDNELTIVLGNADEVPLTLRTYVSDVVPIVNGGFAVAEEDVEPSGTATWIDYPAETFEFAPGDGIERAFTIKIPEDTEPGQYIAGISLQTADALDVEGSSMFRQIIRKTVAVFIIVPGEENPAFELDAPSTQESGSRQFITVPIANTGNILVRPTGALIIATPDGEPVMNAPIELGTIYAGIATILAVPLVSGFEPGDYLISLSLSDGGSGVSAGFENLPLTIEAAEEAENVWNAEAELLALPDADAPVYLEINATITNNGPAATGELELDVLHDGKLVETFSLGSSLSLPQGTTAVTNRYIPPNGFATGEWTFVLRLNIMDPSTGAKTTVFTLNDLLVLNIA
ncbi:MAG: hypothetical protein IT334_10055 [Thermomicrobiales bacterium]|nr:hypothetical protein [Thermomicrobiales bacterium]